MFPNRQTTCLPKAQMLEAGSGQGLCARVNESQQQAVIHGWAESERVRGHCETLLTIGANV